jgi:hypothetical protein
MTGNIASAKKRPGEIVSDLIKAGAIPEEQHEYLARWWSDTQQTFLSMQEPQPLTRKCRADRLRQAAKAGRKFLLELLDEDVRKDAIERERYKLVLPHGPLGPRSNNPGTAAAAIKMDARIEAIKDTIRLLTEQADHVESFIEISNYPTAPRSQEDRQFVAHQIFRLWRRLGRPATLRQGAHGDLLLFADKTFAALPLDQPYKNLTTLRTQLKRWRDRKPRW